MAQSLALFLGSAVSLALTSGCAVGLCCVPLGLAALAASGTADSDSARVQAQTPSVVSHAARTLTLVVEGLPRRGAFL